MKRWRRPRLVALRLAALAVAGGAAMCGGEPAAPADGGTGGPPPADRTTPFPLTDLGRGTYRGFPGGLYPDGRNEPPADHAAEGLRRAARVRPLDAAGRPDPAGKIVLLSIGMSNTSQEFCAAAGYTTCTSWSFMGQAAADPEASRSTLVILNGARGGQVTDTWDSPEDANYERIRREGLEPLGLSEAQVQVVWMKVANARPTASLPGPEADAYRLVEGMGRVARALRSRYPNLQQVFVSSRIYAGFATTALNPEPFAFESGLAVKWLIESQIAQDRGLAAPTPRAGDVRSGAAAPWLAWGPYLWAGDAAQPPRTACSGPARISRPTGRTLRGRARRR